VETRNERDVDRKICNPNTAVVCFDLQNVITLPHAYASNFFYKRKFNFYNLTADCRVNKVRSVYCCVWAENTAGRGGNEIASGLVNILENVVRDNAEIVKIIVWSDSCVPQNRNSFMAFALSSFLSKNPNIQLIEQKFCEPGHSSIQEVDNVHSNIERSMSTAEFFTPIAVIRLLVWVDRKKEYKVLQMTKSRFFDFKASASLLNLHGIPFSRVKILQYQSCNEGNKISFKTSFSKPFQTVTLNFVERRQVRKYITNRNCSLPIPKQLCVKSTVLRDKKQDLLSMTKYMNSVDKAFYTTICSKVK